MKRICELDLLSFSKSYGKESFQQIIGLLESLSDLEFSGIHLKNLWIEGGVDEELKISKHVVNEEFGTIIELIELMVKAHEFDLIVGTDVINEIDYGEDYFAETFIRLKDIGFGFVKVNCSKMICANEVESISRASCGLKLFFNCLPSEEYEFLDIPTLIGWKGKVDGIKPVIDAIF